MHVHNVRQGDSPVLQPTRERCPLTRISIHARRRKPTSPVDPDSLQLLASRPDLSPANSASAHSAMAAAHSAFTCFFRLTCTGIVISPLRSTAPVFEGPLNYLLTGERLVGRLHRIAITQRPSLVTVTCPSNPRSHSKVSGPISLLNRIPSPFEPGFPLSPPRIVSALLIYRWCTTKRNRFPFGAIFLVLLEHRKRQWMMFRGRAPHGHQVE